MNLKYDTNGLIPVVVQRDEDGKILMVAYANAEAVRKTAETGTAWFYSRSRRALWNKGETSGNFINIRRIDCDCDRDTLIYYGMPMGPVCHTGHETCFFETIWECDKG